MIRAHTFNDAIALGLSDYAWDGVPLGSWEGRLDFKAWGKVAGGSLICCFTEIHTGSKY